MRVVNEELLRSFSGPGYCEFCRKWVQSRDAAHVFARGMGSGSRLDIAINLVSLCTTMAGGDNCHHANHNNGRPTRENLLQLVAAREGTTRDWIEAELFRLRREPKGGLLVVPRDATEVRRAADLLAWALGGVPTGECSAVIAALAALQWALGEGSFGRDVLAPLLKLRTRTPA